MRRLVLTLAALLAAGSPSAVLAQIPASAPAAKTSDQLGYRWERLTEHAAFPGAYNFPVRVLPDGRFLALHTQGVWESRDGRTWTRAALPLSGLNSAYLDYVQHDGAIYALGKHRGSDYDITITPVVQQTTDYRTWRQLGTSTTLPKLFFYGSADFKGWMWIVGGRTKDTVSSAIWRSKDGLAWEKVTDAAPFGGRENPQLVTFKDRLWLIGGGGSAGTGGAVWSSADGVSWREEAKALNTFEPFGYAAAVFDGKIWLLGANRSGSFSSEMLVSDDGRSWTPVTAPWSPRGAVAAWVAADALYITGGKYSRPGPDGQPVFIYSNDVWRMTRR